MLGRPEPPKRKAPDRLPDDIDAAVRKISTAVISLRGQPLTTRAYTLSSETRKSQKSAETKKSNPSMNSVRYALIRSRISIRSNASSMSQQDAL